MFKVLRSSIAVIGLALGACMAFVASASTTTPSTPLADARQDLSKAGQRVLVIQDEREAMEVLASFLKERGAVDSLIVEQPAAMAQRWSDFGAVIVYVHGALEERVELRMRDYVREGGRLIAIHHTIAGGKAVNRHLFSFAGMHMPGGGTPEAMEPTQPGGAYAWRSGVELSIVNINPGHYITSHDVEWPQMISYASSDGPAVERTYPGYTAHSEAYLNHYFTDGRDKTVLLGFKYRDDRNGAFFMQDRAGWMKPMGRGWLIYLQPGHYVAEFRIPAFRQMVLNAIRWRPDW